MKSRKRTISSDDLAELEFGLTGYALDLYRLHEPEIAANAAVFDDLSDIDEEAARNPLLIGDDVLECVEEVSKKTKTEEQAESIVEISIFKQPENLSNVNRRARVKEPTAVHIAVYAALKGKNNIAAVVAAHPELLEVPDSNGHQPLFIAMYYAHEGAMLALLEAGADMHLQVANVTCLTPYSFAKEYCQEALAIFDEFTSKKKLR